MSIRDRFKAAPNPVYSEQLREAANSMPTRSKKAGRPSSGKVVVSLRLEPEVVEKFRATGPGWQARMNDVLKAAKV